MSAVARAGTRAARFEAKLAATEAQLSGRELPASSGWLQRAREAALGRLKAMGLPEKRDEYWRFTDPSRLAGAAVTPASVLQVTDEKAEFEDIDRLKLVFVDGVFDAAASDDLTLEGIEISRLADAGQRDIHWAQDLYSALEAEGQNPVPRPMAAHNAAFASDGVLIRVTGKPSKPVSLVYRRQAEDAEAILHHVIRLEQGAEMTLLENGPAAARYSIDLEACIADGATLHHVRAQGRDHGRSGTSHLFARLGEESVFKSFTMTANGAVLRNEAMIWLNGKGGSAHIAGAAMGDGAFHHDDTVFINHAAPACESRQVYKKVLRNGAVGVFQGKILVDQIAQKTDGYQISQALLFDESSQFLAKPELEIYADDVVCSHGSTSGEIDPDQLFYLRARGISEDEAEGLLVLAFLAEALDEIESDVLTEEMRSRLQGWVHRHQR